MNLLSVKKLPSVLFFVLAVSNALPVAAADSQSDDWKFRASLNGWLPGLEGKTKFEGPDSPDGGIDVETIVDSIETVFMGSLTVEKGRWGGFSDYIYIDLSNTKSNIKSLSIPNGGVIGEASYKAELGVTGWVWNAAATYTLVDHPAYNMRLLGGVRFFDLEEEFNWELNRQVGSSPGSSRSGKLQLKDNVMDAIVGARGRIKFGDSNWYAPYYIDVGTGQSEFTWQAAAGLGYAFESIDLSLSYRHLEWNYDSGNLLESLSFSGAQFGVAYRW